jgi:hypothetical protein
MSRRLARALLVLATLLPLAACSKPTVETCDKGCRNYFTLHYWEEAEAEIARAPESERAALRAKKVSELEPRMTQGLELCVQKCRSGADQARAKCWMKAATTADAKQCEND